MHKFKVIQPNNKDTNIEKWVTVSNDSKNVSTTTTPRIPSSFSPIENVTFSKCDQNLVVKSKKIIRSPNFIKNNSTKNCKQKSISSKNSETKINVESQSLTPKSSKIIYSPGIIRDTKDWRLDTARSTKQVTNSVGITYRSYISVTGTEESRLYLDSSRILFKPENCQNLDVNNLVTVVSNSKNFDENDYRLPPTFSARTSENDFRKEDMSESVIQSRKRTDMPNKVLEGRKEIEKYKTELVTLLNKAICSQNKTSIVKQNSPPKINKSPVSIRKRSPIVNHNTNIKEEPKIKSKGYNLESTREFIKRQKLRRKEKLQQEELKKLEIEEFKKQKLEELKQKTHQILTENVKKTSNKKVCDKPNDDQLAATNKSSQNSLQTKRCRARSFDPKKGGNNIDQKNALQSHRRSRSISSGSKISDVNSPPKTLRIKPVVNIEPNRSRAKLEQSSNALKKQQEIDKNEAAKKIQRAFRNFQQRRKPESLKCTPIIPANNKEIKTIKSVDNEEKLPSELTKYGKIESKIDESAAREIDTIKQKLESSISQLDLKNKKTETPSWLLPPSTLPYPYNFISAVRRKLEIATKTSYVNYARDSPKNEKTEKEVQTLEEKKSNMSIQCTIDNHKVKEIPQKLEELKTYNSHKCRKQLTYKCIPQIISPDNDKDSKLGCNSKSTNVSDSDTTKNIPEISEEGQLSTHSSIHKPENVEISKNITFTRKQYDDLTKPDCKINAAKLSTNRSKYPADIDSILSQYSKTKSSNNNYSADFNSSAGQMSNHSTSHQTVSGYRISKSFSNHSTVNNLKQSNLDNSKPSGDSVSDSQIKTEFSNTSVTSHSKQITFDNFKTESQSTISSKENSSIKTDSEDNKTSLQSSVPKLSKPAINLKIKKGNFFQDVKNNPNQIHLKFQAEVHLLNSFNNSLQQVVAVEKSLLDLPKEPSSINYKRGCDASDVLEPSICSQDLNISEMDKSALSSTCNSLVSKMEDSFISRKNPYIGVSLGMFDQMIKDEDNRLEHFKAILKLRNKALFDRTKGELTWLEMRKKELRENGQINDVTVIKKKQRGLIIKLEQERHEMQRLKQAHKQAAKERKNALREQKNIIKQQLSSTDQIPKKIRRLSHSERRHSGPVKVYRVESKTKQIKETTMSRNSSETDETISVTSVVTQISEKISTASEEFSNSLALKKEKTNFQARKFKRELLMKEADLEKRRKEAEELLKWHERLKEKEAHVVELERQTKSIQLDKKKKIYVDNKHQMSKSYKNARKIFKEISEERNSSKCTSEDSYSSDFDPSIMTQINETDFNLSPNKMISERLRKISESSRIDFITSKAETDVSEHSILSRKLSSDIPITCDVNSNNKESKTLSSDSDLPELQIISQYENNAVKSESTIIPSEISSLQNDSESQILSMADLVKHTDDKTTSDQNEIKSELSKFENKTEEQSSHISNDQELSDEIHKEILEKAETTSQILEEQIEISKANDSSSNILAEDQIPLASLSDSSSEIKSLNENVSDSETTKKQTSSNKDTSIEDKISENNEISIHSERLHTHKKLSIDLTQLSNGEPVYSETEINDESNIKESIFSAKSETQDTNDISESKSGKKSNEIITSVESIPGSTKSDEKTEIQEERQSNSSLSEPFPSNASEISEMNYEFEESKAQEQNITSEISTVPKSETDLNIKSKANTNESEIYDQNDFDTDYTSPPEEKDVSDTVQSEKDDEYSKTENDHKTIIESPKSDQEEFKITEENLNKKSISLESEELDEAIENLNKKSTSSENEELDEAIKNSNKKSISSESDELDKANENSIKKSTSSENEELDEAIENLNKKSASSESVQLNEAIENSNRKSISSEIEELDEAIENSNKKSISSESEDLDEAIENSNKKVISSESEDLDQAIENANKKSISSDSEGLDEAIENSSMKSTSSESEELDEAIEAKSEHEKIQKEDNVGGVSHIDVRKRVSEILADATISRGDKSPRLQDLYVTAYDVTTTSPESTPELGSPPNEHNKQDKSTFTVGTPYRNEAEELFRKQLEIEQEIKQLERQQQNIPYLFMREIPNKPPPPYKPPNFPLVPVVSSIIPVHAEQIQKIVNQAADVLFTAYERGSLKEVSFTFSEDEKVNSQKFVFDLCKEIALDVCKPTVEVQGPSWRSRKNTFKALISRKPLDRNALFSVMNKKVLQLLNFEPVIRKDNLIIRWSRKKRDHVDEILVLESQAEEAEWTNYDSDEQTVKDNLTSDIMNMLILETAQNMGNILKKKNITWTQHC